MSELPSKPSNKRKRVRAPVSLEPEQIGTLHFVPNPEYPYPFDVEVPPRFWMEETTGVLAEAVDAYMAGDRLSAAQLEALKYYLQQFIERAVLAGDANRKLLLQQVAKLRTVADVERFADQVSEYGAEVF